MSKKIALLGFLFTFLFGSMAYAHPGRTDANGGILAEPIVVTGDLVLASIIFTMGAGLHQAPAAVRQAVLQKVALT